MKHQPLRHPKNKTPNSEKEFGVLFYSVSSVEGIRETLFPFPCYTWEREDKASLLEIGKR